MTVYRTSRHMGNAEISMSNMNITVMPWSVNIYGTVLVNVLVQETQSADRNHTTLQLATVEQPPQMHDTDSRQHNALALKLSGSARLYVPVNELVLETGCQRIGPAILINGM